LKRDVTPAFGLCGIRTWFSLFQRFVLSGGQRRLFRIPSPSVLDQRFRDLRRAFWRGKVTILWLFLKTFLPSLAVPKHCLLLSLFSRVCGRNEFCLTYQEVTKKRFITVMSAHIRAPRFQAETRQSILNMQNILLCGGYMGSWVNPAERTTDLLSTLGT